MGKARTAYSSVRAWMKATGISIGQLGSLTGIERSHLSKILSGDKGCSTEKLLKLAEVTGVPVENVVRSVIRDRRARSKASDRTVAAELP
jgi:transcriptional regulator with XRE-family HTH domain